MPIYYDAKGDKITDGYPPKSDHCGSNRKSFYQDVEVEGKKLNLCFECNSQKV